MIATPTELIKTIATAMRQGTTLRTTEMITTAATITRMTITATKLLTIIPVAANIPKK